MTNLEFSQIKNRYITLDKQISEKAMEALTIENVIQWRFDMAQLIDAYEQNKRTLDKICKV